MNPSIQQRIISAGVLPEFEAALLSLIDTDSVIKSAGRVKLHEFLGEIYRSLGATNNDSLQDFLSAWHILMSAMLRLDHLQDQDPIQLPLPSNASLGAQYNLVIGYYTLAWSLLDNFGIDVPLNRLLRLRQLWSNMLLNAASGQQRDLGSMDNQANALDQYQEVARAKSGSFYALAFGGVAALATDNILFINALTAAGEIFGMLEQLSDDLVDVEEETTDYTLRRAYQIAVQHTPLHLSSEHLLLYWQYICKSYIEYLQNVTNILPEEVKDIINKIFNLAFGKYYKLEK